MTTSAGRVAVVTGAARGIGYAISCELARRGSDVIAVDRDSCRDTVVAIRAIGRNALSVTADLSEPEQVANVTADLLGFAGHVDILVNNAGVFPTKNIFDLEFAEWKRVQQINIDSQFLMTKAVIESMRDNGWGRIVNIASNTIALAIPNMVAYMTSKGAVIGLTRALATDLAPSGITVNAVCPSATRTPGMLKVAGDERLQMIAKMQAIKRVGEATDILGTVCFLASEDAAFLTGQTIVVDGGLMRV